MPMTTCYRYANGKFSSASSPLDTTIDNFDSALTNAGYFPQLQSVENSVATIYQHVSGKNDEPHFLIDLWGESSQLAMLVADDFNHLVETMRAIEPLMGMLSLT